MPIDMASVYAERFKANPQVLRAVVLTGESPDPKLDAYTALNALKLLGEARQAQMAQMAQQPTSAPSIASTTLAQFNPQPVPQAVAQAAPAPAMQASGGLADMPSGEHNYAPGGIVSFAEPTAQNNYSLVQGPPSDMPTNTLMTAALRRGLYGEDEDEGEDDVGDYGSQQMYGREAVRSLRSARKAEKYKPMTPDEEMAYQQRYYEQMKAQAGTSPIDAFLAKYNITPEKAAKMDDEDLGMAMLKAAGVAVQPGGTMRGLAAAAATLGETYGEAKKARRREEMANDRMRVELLDSQRKERMGMTKDAAAALERYRKDRVESAKANAQAHRLEAQTYAQLSAAFRPRAAAKEATPKPEAEGVAALTKFLIDKQGMDPVTAKAMATLQYRAGPAGVTGQPKSMKDARDALKNYQILNPEAWEQKVKAIGVEAATDQYIDEYMRGAVSPPFQQLPGTAPRAAPAPTAKPATPGRSNW